MIVTTYVRLPKNKKNKKKSARLRLLCIPHCHVFLLSGTGNLLFSCLGLYPPESVFRGWKYRLWEIAMFTFNFSNKKIRSIKKKSKFYFVKLYIASADRGGGV